MTWNRLLLPLIHSIEKEVVYDKGKEYKQFYNNFTTEPCKAIRKTAKHCAVSFPLDLRPKKVTLTIKLKKRK